MRLFKAASLFALFLSALQAVAQTTPPGDITVRVLTLAHLHQIQLTPLDQAASLRTCSTCAPHTARSAITLTASAAELSLSLTPGSPSSRSTEIFADGGFRLVAPQQPPLLLIGKLHITASANQLLVRLTLPMERYVVGVLNGETAPDEPLESLQAMAIVTRTYAVTNRRRHPGEGFDLCDDTHCQVVRFTAARPLVEQAVNDTAGETLWYQRAPATVFFHQHCGGMTADVRDVFQNEHTAPAPYLRAHRDIYCVRKSSAEWESEVRLADLEDALSHSGIKADLTDNKLAVAAHTETGRVRTLTLGSATIPANTFRLAANRALGWTTIKSDWYEIETRGDTVSFHGRGSGHGVGLCQIGAAEMAREGHDAPSILAEYFPGTNLGVTASDRGWLTQKTPPFSISAVNPSDLQRALPTANVAWQQASARFPSAPITTPLTVRTFPTVELFRQSTNQPGWVAASTQGKIISLEPLTVLQQKHLFASVLEHEFLHVLVESECTPTTPLWLREGIVEALSEQHLHATSAAWLTARLDRQLAQPASHVSAIEAHTQAGLRVSEYIRRYGLPAVRQWLHSGVPANVLAASFALPGNSRNNAALPPHPHARHANRD